MGRHRVKHRSSQIKIKQKRKVKLAKLRDGYALAKTREAKDKALEKVQKIAPWLSKEEFLTPKV